MSVTISPKVRVERRLSERATSDGRKPRSRAAASTRACVAGLARPTPDRTRLTVAVDTPARRATSAMVVAIAGSGCRRIVRERDGVRIDAQRHGRELLPGLLATGEHLEVGLELLELGAAAHQAVKLLGVELAAAERAARPPAGQDRERIADRQRVLDVVGDEDHPEALVAGRDRVAEHERRLLDAERRGRLVEDQDARTEILGAGDREGLALAAGQGPNQLFGVADVDADVLHLLAGDRRRLRAVESAERPEPDRRLVAEEEVPADAHQRHDRQVLVDRRDPRVERVARRREGDRLAVDREGAVVGRVDAREGLDQGRLAGAVVAEQAVDLARPDRERYALEGDDGTEVLRDVAGLEERLAGGALRGGGRGRAAGGGGHRHVVLLPLASAGRRIDAGSSCSGRPRSAAGGRSRSCTSPR